MPEKKLNFIIAAANAENGDDKNATRCKVTGTAYSGGKMNVGMWGEAVVVALDGIDCGAENIPLLMNHENSTDSRLGTLTAKIVDGSLVIEGDIIAETDEAKNVVAQMRAGKDWQMSIGASVDDYEMVKAGVKMKVNGQEFEGPFYLISKSTLREVSVVAVGADSSTQMKIAAKLNLKPKGDKAMPDDLTPAVAAANAAPAQPTPAPVAAKADEPVNIQATAADARAAADEAVKAERKRVADIRAICAGEFPEIEAEAIDNGLGIDEVREKVLAAFRKKQPTTAPNVIIKAEQTDAKTLEASFMLRAGLGEEDVQKAYGDQTLEAAAKARDISMKELFCESLKIEGKNPGRSFGNDTIEAAFSTVSLPGILNNVANKVLLRAFNAQPIIATKLCSTGDLNDFKESERYRLTDVGDLKPVAADGEIKDGGLTEEKSTNQLETYAKKFCLTRKMILNDDLGAFLKVPTAMGNRAARLIDQLFFARLLANPAQSDGQNLFSAAHGNLLTGSTSALGVDSLQAAVKAFLDQTDADGQPISIEPRYLLVPTELKFKAIELTKGAVFIATGDTDTLRPALNSLADENLQVVSSPYLANAAYAGSSNTAWYLFGDPSQTDTFEIGYLKGKRTPTIEKGDTDFNTLGMWFRVYFDLGVREQGFRGKVKSNGAA